LVIHLPHRVSDSAECLIRGQAYKFLRIQAELLDGVLSFSGALSGLSCAADHALQCGVELRDLDASLLRSKPHGRQLVRGDAKPVRCLGKRVTSLQAIPEVTILAGPVDTGEVDEEGNPITVDLDPQERTGKVVEDAGAQWAGDAAELPDSGMVEADTIYRYGEDEIWYVIQAFDRSVYSDHPSTYPALIRRVRNPNEQGEWRQPLDQFDAYYVVNPFTGQPDQVTHNGLDYHVTSGDAEGLNVWEPGTQNSGWTQGVYVPPVEGEEPEPEEPTIDEWAAGTTYTAGDQGTYQTLTYQCLQGHTAIVGWEPPNVPALWSLV